VYVAIFKSGSSSSALNLFHLTGIVEENSTEEDYKRKAERKARVTTD
jgi:hypothetical protein